MRDAVALGRLLDGATIDRAVRALRPDYRALLIAADGIVPGPGDEHSERLLASAEAAAAGGRSDVAGLLRLHAELAATAAQEAERVAGLLADHPGVAVATAAARPGDVHDVAALREVAVDLAGAHEDPAPG